MIPIANLKLNKSIVIAILKQVDHYFKTKQQFARINSS